MCVLVRGLRFVERCASTRELLARKVLVLRLLYEPHPPTITEALPCDWGIPAPIPYHRSSD